MQIDAMAKSDDVEYFQVVGDFLVPLNKCKIESAVARATTTEMIPAPRLAPKVAIAPTVIVKRRRVPVMA